jgi:hypothetical protein
MVREALRIQKIIAVRNTTATTERLPPSNSWCLKVICAVVKVRTAPTATESSTAASTPRPHPAQRVPAVGLHQECDQDAHDQGGLKAFAEPDERTGKQHWRASST